MKYFIFCFWPHPPLPSPEGDGAVLHIFNHLYNYHISYSSLLSTFEDPDLLRSLRKAGLCVVPLLEERAGEVQKSLIYDKLNILSQRNL